MARQEIQIIDSRTTREQPADIGPHILIERNQSLPAEEVYDGRVRATFITGYDHNGQLVDERGLLERRGLGKLRQFVTEKWKVSRVKRTVAKTAFRETVPSI